MIRLLITSITMCFYYNYCNYGNKKCYYNCFQIGDHGPMAMTHVDPPGLGQWAETESGAPNFPFVTRQKRGGVEKTGDWLNWLN